MKGFIYCNYGNKFILSLYYEKIEITKYFKLKNIQFSYLYKNKDEEPVKNSNDSKNQNELINNESLKNDKMKKLNKKKVSEIKISGELEFEYENYFKINCRAIFTYHDEKYSAKLELPEMSFVDNFIKLKNVSIEFVYSKKEIYFSGGGTLNIGKVSITAFILCSIKGFGVILNTKNLNLREFIMYSFKKDIGFDLTINQIFFALHRLDEDDSYKSLLKEIEFDPLFDLCLKYKDQVNDNNLNVKALENLENKNSILKYCKTPGINFFMKMKVSNLEFILFFSSRLKEKMELKFMVCLKSSLKFKAISIERYKNDEMGIFENTDYKGPYGIFIIENGDFKMEINVKVELFGKCGVGLFLKYENRKGTLSLEVNVSDFFILQSELTIDFDSLYISFELAFSRSDDLDKKINGKFQENSVSRCLKSCLSNVININQIKLGFILSRDLISLNVKASIIILGYTLNFNFNIKLKDYTKIIEEIIKQLCIDCDKKIEENNELEKNLKEYIKSSNSEKMIVCPFCSFNLINELEKHKEKCKYIKCEECSREIYQKIYENHKKVCYKNDNEIENSSINNIIEIPENENNEKIINNNESKKHEEEIIKKETKNNTINPKINYENSLKIESNVQSNIPKVSKDFSNNNKDLTSISENETVYKDQISNKNLNDQNYPLNKFKVSINAKHDEMHVKKSDLNNECVIQNKTTNILNKFENKSNKENIINIPNIQFNRPTNESYKASNNAIYKSQLNLNESNNNKITEISLGKEEKNKDVEKTDFSYENIYIEFNLKNIKNKHIMDDIDLKNKRYEFCIGEKNVERKIKPVENKVINKVKQNHVIGNEQIHKLKFNYENEINLIKSLNNNKAILEELYCFNQFVSNLKIRIIIEYSNGAIQSKSHFYDCLFYFLIRNNNKLEIILSGNEVEFSFLPYTVHKLEDILTSDNLYDLLRKLNNNELLSKESPKYPSYNSNLDYIFYIAEKIPSSITQSLFNELNILPNKIMIIHFNDKINYFLMDNINVKNVDSSTFFNKFQSGNYLTLFPFLEPEINEESIEFIKKVIQSSFDLEIDNTFLFEGEKPKFLPKCVWNIKENFESEKIKDEDIKKFLEIYDFLKKEFKSKEYPNLDTYLEANQTTNCGRSKTGKLLDTLGIINMIISGYTDLKIFKKNVKSLNKYTFFLIIELSSFSKLYLFSIILPFTYFLIQNFMDKKFPFSILICIGDSIFTIKSYLNTSEKDFDQSWFKLIYLFMYTHLNNIFTPIETVRIGLDNALETIRKASTPGKYIFLIKNDNFNLTRNEFRSFEVKLVVFFINQMTNQLPYEFSFINISSLTNKYIHNTLYSMLKEEKNKSFKFYKKQDIECNYPEQVEISFKNHLFIYNNNDNNNDNQIEKNLQTLNLVNSDDLEEEESSIKVGGLSGLLLFLLDLESKLKNIKNLRENLDKD